MVSVGYCPTKALKSGPYKKRVKLDRLEVAVQWLVLLCPKEELPNANEVRAEDVMNQDPTGTNVEILDTVQVVRVDEAQPEVAKDKDDQNLTLKNQGPAKGMVDHTEEEKGIRRAVNTRERGLPQEEPSLGGPGSHSLLFHEEMVDQDPAKYMVDQDPAKYMVDKDQVRTGARLRRTRRQPDRFQL